MTKVNYKIYPIERLEEFSRRVFEHYGVPKGDAALAAEVLAMSDLRGIDSHGVGRLYSYSEMLEHGRINPKPKIKILRESPSTATVDGDNGLGLVVGPRANEIAMEKAAQVGTGWVSVSHTNHYGIAGYYPIRALERDMIGWSMTNTTKLVQPLWGGESMLGTNPIAIAFPGLEEPDVVIDLATSAVAYGKVEIARRKREGIPDGWAIGADGVNTNDPQTMIDGGALTPLGSFRELGGHKGYCLAAMVDVLCCVLSGANWGPFAPPFTLRQQIPERSVGKGIGHFFGAMSIDAFIEVDEFKRQIDDWVRTMRATKPQPGSPGVLIPGDPEREAEQVRAKEGVPVVMTLVEELREISKRTGVAFD
ncbi:MAG: Ldh family oxidoreductase [Planctomycetota bacterium]|jgi:LDH2 family malate/lactate/ureidoglycolate dehydrogenase|nr:Ldh family oxidoreductase [Planctomycetota bacterium]